MWLMKGTASSYMQSKIRFSGNKNSSFDEYTACGAGIFGWLGFNIALIPTVLRKSINRMGISSYIVISELSYQPFIE